jgi:hypothetical protein
MSLWSRIKGALGSAQAEPATAEELFTVEVETALGALPFVGRVTRQPEFSLAIESGGSTRRMFLANIFGETRDLSPADRAERIRRFVAIIAEPKDDDPSWSEVGERLVPVLRGATGFIRTGADAPLQPIRRRFVPFLIECVGLDSEHSFSFVNPKMLAKWSVDAGAVFAAARENGARCFGDGDVARHPSEGSSAVWRVARDDSYETSRLILPGWLAGFAGKVTGRPVAIAPSRSTLMVGGDGDEGCLRQLVETARREFEAAPRRISPALYTVDDGGAVVPLVLPADHPLAADVAVGHVMLATYEYRQQQERLQEQLGEDIFVASYTGVRRQEGAVFSYATWTKDVPSLLPRTDKIAFTGFDGDEVLLVPWQAAADLVADCLALDPGHDPPRWRTDRWPDAVTIEKLRAAVKP